jgi:integrase
VATFNRFRRVRKAIQELAAESDRDERRLQWIRLELALVLTEATGARIGAIRGLRWSDINLSPPRLHWRSEFDKRGRDRLVPMPAELAEEIRRFQSKLGGIGDAWVFPRRDGQGPWSRDQFSQKLVVAEHRAGLEHQRGGIWHPYRRKWATERKEYPLVDVMATGGWKDVKTLLTCYQYTDEQSMLAVMEAPKKLLSLEAS